MISVIVPVYKVEKYLDACVESIVNQTYRNLEIILVDDGSPDNCPAMCDAWAEKDNRIKVIHKENGGLSDARNIGMAYATGEYIGFVDSDDKIAFDMYEKLLKLLVENNADAVQCSMYIYYNFLQTEFYAKCESLYVRLLTANQAVEALLYDKGVYTTCPNMLLTSELAKKVQFDIGVINEDVMWVYRILKNSKKTVITNEQLYYYFQRQGSIMNSCYTEKRFDALNALEQRAKEIKTDFPKLYPMALRNYIGSCMYHYQTLCRLPESDEYEKFKKIIHKRFCEYDIGMISSVLSTKYKIWYTMFRYAPDMTCNIRNKLGIGL